LRFFNPDFSTVVFISLDTRVLKQHTVVVISVRPLVGSRQNGQASLCLLRKYLHYSSLKRSIALLIISLSLLLITLVEFCNTPLCCIVENYMTSTDSYKTVFLKCRENGRSCLPCVYQLAA
jgi:hypothetical protein